MLKNIIYGTSKIEFGNCLLAKLDGAICWLSFFDDSFDNSMESAIKELQKKFGQAILTIDNKWAQELAQKIFVLNNKFKFEDFVVFGTDFQKKVWLNLCNIPYGCTVSYSDIAKNMGMPKATRAVASAIAKNNISFLIPCHRVIRKSGDIHKYRWGAHYKRTLLAWEKNNILGRD